MGKTQDEDIIKPFPVLDSALKAFLTVRLLFENLVAALHSMTLFPLMTKQEYSL
jgi:hypothetical protein